MALQVPQGTVKEIRQNILLDKINLGNTVHCILENWASMNQANAILNVLITELENNGLRECPGRTTLLHHAAKHGNLEAVEMLLEDKRMDVNAKDEFDLTPLNHAITCIWCGDIGKHLEVAMALHNRGGTFRERIGHADAHVLHVAILHRSLELVRLLVQFGVDVNVKDRNGNTALHLVVLQNPPFSIRRNFLFAKTIIDAGADPTLVNNQGKTPLEIALAHREAAKEKVFFASIAKVSLTLALKFSFLWTPTEDSNEAFSLLSREFIDSTGNINYQDSQGNSLLHIVSRSARSGLPDDVKVLINSGANVNLKNNKNQTPLHFAADLEDKDVSLEIIQILIKNGADAYATDNQTLNFVHVYMNWNPRLSPSQKNNVTTKTPTPSQFQKLVEYLMFNKLYDILELAGFSDQATHILGMKDRQAD